MTTINYAFKIINTDSKIEDMTNFIRTIRRGVTLTDCYLNVFVDSCDQIDSDTGDRILSFNVQVPACPIQQSSNIQHKFITAFLDEFYYDRKSMIIETTLTD